MHTKTTLRNSAPVKFHINFCFPNLFLYETLLLFFITNSSLSILSEFMFVIYLPNLTRDFEYLLSPYRPYIYNITKVCNKFLFLNLTRKVFPAPLWLIHGKNVLYKTAVTPSLTNICFSRLENRNASIFCCRFYS